MLKYALILTGPDCRPARAAFHLSTVLVALALSAGIQAQTGDRARTESQARRANERLNALQREADALAAEQRSVLIDLRRLEVQRDLRSEQLRQIQSDARTVSQELVNTANQIDAIEAETAASQPVLESRMVELYKLGAPGYVRLLLNVSDPKEFSRAYRMVAAVAAVDRQRVEQHKDNLRKLREAQTALEQKRGRMAGLQRAANDARSAAERAALARAELVEQIDQRRDLTAELANELQAAQIKLQQTLGAINAGIPRPSSDGSALPIRPFRGQLEWPVEGRMLTRFGRRRGGASSTPTEAGVQFATNEGSPVRAVHDGTVAFSGPFTGYGNLVILDHGAQTFSLYGQLSAPQVEAGAKIERGQTIGTTGHVLAGIAGAYFEMRVDGKPVDPLEWLRKR